MRYDAEHKQRTRERVLKEAAAAIRAEGPERLAVAGVMKRAGLTHGGFYAHFASKDDLIVAAIEHSFAEAFEAFGLFTRGRTAAQGLAAYIDFYLSPWHRERRDEGCPLPALAADLPRLAAPAREAFERGAARLTTAIAERLQVLEQPQPGRLAVSVLSEMVGAIVLARSIADAAHAGAILDASRAALKARLGLA